MADFEHIEKGEMQSDYAQVIFNNIPETYPPDVEVKVNYTVTRYHSPSSRDWVGLYRVGWVSSKEHLCYHWAPIPADHVPGNAFNAAVTFTGSQLPSVDGEFHQFCYVTSSGQVRGASTPFQFRKPSEHEYIELEDQDSDMLVVQTRTRDLQDKLAAALEEKIQIERMKVQCEKDAERYLEKLTESENHVTQAREQNAALEAHLKAAQSDIEQLKQREEEKQQERAELERRCQQLNQEKELLASQLNSAETRCAQLEKELKRLQNVHDQLAGKCSRLEAEKRQYQENLMTQSVTQQQLEQLQEELECKQEQILSLGHVNSLLQTDLSEERSRQRNHRATGEQEKRMIGDLQTQVQALSDQKEALQELKGEMGSKINSYEAHIEHLNKYIETSGDEKEQLQTMLAQVERAFTELKATTGEKSDIQRVQLISKAEECDALKHEVAKLEEAFQRRSGDNEGCMFVLRQAQQELKKRLSKMESEKRDREKQLYDWTKKKSEWESRERELVREIEGLTERLQMGKEAYQKKYLECRKLDAQLRKFKDLESGEKPAMQTQTSVRWEGEEGLSNEELQQQMASLSRELEERSAKAKQYKQQWQHEKDKNALLQRDWRARFEVKDMETEALKQRLREVEIGNELRITRPPQANEQHGAQKEVATAEEMRFKNEEIVRDFDPLNQSALKASSVTSSTETLKASSSGLSGAVGGDQSSTDLKTLAESGPSTSISSETFKQVEGSTCDGLMAANAAEPPNTNLNADFFKPVEGSTLDANSTVQEPRQPAQKNNKLTCEVCKLTFPKSGEQQLEAHKRDAHSTSTPPPIAPQIPPKREEHHKFHRKCPVCEQRFAEPIKIDDYNIHVNRHFDN